MAAVDGGVAGCRNDHGLVTGPFGAGVPAVCGDVDGDGSATAADLALLSGYLAGSVSADALDLVEGDLVGNGNVSTVDLYLLKRRFTGGRLRGQLLEEPGQTSSGGGAGIPSPGSAMG